MNIFRNLSQFTWAWIRNVYAVSPEFKIMQTKKMENEKRLAFYLIFSHFVCKLFLESMLKWWTIVVISLRFALEVLNQIREQAIKSSHILTIQDAMEPFLDCHKIKIKVLHTSKAFIYLFSQASETMNLNCMKISFRSHFIAILQEGLDNAQRKFIDFHWNDLFLVLVPNNDGTKKS